jgi:hypothetical protein
MCSTVSHWVSIVWIYVYTEKKHTISTSITKRKRQFSNQYSTSSSINCSFVINVTLQLKPSTKAKLVSTRCISRGHKLYRRRVQYLYSLSNYLFFKVLIQIKINFQEMESNSRAESRFRYCNYYFYIGGVPLFASSVSKWYHMCIVFSYVCAYSSIIAMFLSIYHDIEDLNEVMDAAMFFIISSAASCTQLYFR